MLTPEEFHERPEVVAARDNLRRLQQEHEAQQDDLAHKEASSAAVVSGAAVLQ